MWEQLERSRNHFLQMEIKDVMKPSAINCHQNKSMSVFLKKREYCNNYPKDDVKNSTYFEDRSQLAYGWFALPKLMKQLDSDVPLTHWRALVSLSEFLLNPLNAERAILEMDIVRKVKNAFLRWRLKLRLEQYREIELILKIFITISRSLRGAKCISDLKCLMTEFYKIIKDKELLKDELAAEILFNLTSKPKVLSVILSDEGNLASVAYIFKQDPCRPHYPEYLWLHLCHMLELSPERGIELGFFELLHLRIAKRLPKFWEMSSKAFAMLLRCPEGQRRFDDVDGVKMIYESFSRDAGAKDFEYIALIVLNGLHSKRALWRSREFTMLPCELGRRMSTDTNPRLQLYCLKGLRQLATMPCIKRYIIGNWIQEIGELKCIDADAECARDSLLSFLRADIADSS